MFVRSLLLVTAIFVVWVIYIANTGQPNAFLGYVKSIPYGDKMGHFALSGILTLLANLSLHCRYITLGRVKILLGTLIVMVLVSLEEYSQLYLTLRKFSLWDLLSDFVGIALFSIIAIQIHNAKKTNP